jgi:hypothetical protein
MCGLLDRVNNQLVLLAVRLQLFADVTLLHLDNLVVRDLSVLGRKLPNFFDRVCLQQAASSLWLGDFQATFGLQIYNRLRLLAEQRTLLLAVDLVLLQLCNQLRSIRLFYKHCPLISLLNDPEAFRASRPEGLSFLVFPKINVVVVQKNLRVLWFVLHWIGLQRLSTVVLHYLSP